MQHPPCSLLMHGAIVGELDSRFVVNYLTSRVEGLEHVRIIRSSRGKHREEQQLLLEFVSFFDSFRA